MDKNKKLRGVVAAGVLAAVAFANGLDKFEVVELSDSILGIIHTASAFLIGLVIKSPLSGESKEIEAPKA